MGQEIETDRFSNHDVEAFGQRLRSETDLLQEWFEQGQLDQSAPIGGFELEAWLVDRDCEPALVNQQLLARLDPELYTSELARFNIEINNPAIRLGGDFLDAMQTSLQSSWDDGRRAAAAIGVDLCMVGILPTLRQAHLNVDAMTPLKRYAAINRQILSLRKGAPLRIDILGNEHLRTEHNDVMLESATTSFQIHTQIPLARAARYYNASMLVSAPLVAAAANSPLVFGKDLWAESRIPLFEQSIAVGGFEDAAAGPLHRVGFGSGYARKSLFECFAENLEHYPVLLPVPMDLPSSDLAHLRLHNGTVWRWNRPLICTDGKTPHLRIEHRVLPGGPSVTDVVANAALYYGLAHYYSVLDPAPENSIEFAEVRDNFYLAARHGLDARIVWPGHAHRSVRRLLLDELIPCARQGLLDLGFRHGQSQHYLDLIQARVETGQTGAEWQRAALRAHNGSLRNMTELYLEHQESGHPVHEWPL